MWHLKDRIDFLENNKIEQMSTSTSPPLSPSLDITNDRLSDVSDNKMVQSLQIDQPNLSIDLGDDQDNLLRWVSLILIQ